jgi:hypothetical protein
MSKHLLSIMLNELQIVRLVCKGDHGKCGTVIEVPVKGSNEMECIQCPKCRLVYRHKDGSTVNDSLRNLESALRHQHDNFDIEFVIPAKD